MSLSGVSFNGTHCLDGMGIILAQKTIGLPSTQTYYVQVPGRDGVIDLTESLLGEVRYNSRTLTMTFVTCDHISKSNWASLLSDIAVALHGKQQYIIFDDDEAFYYKGRCEINSFATSWGKQTIVIEATCDPYKYDINSPGMPWLWDPFSFVDGIIYNNQITVEGEDTESYINRAKRVTPTFVCSSAMTVIYKGTEYQLKEGETIIYDLTFAPNETVELTFIGYGTVTVSYEAGVL